MTRLKSLIRSSVYFLVAAAGVGLAQRQELPGSPATLHEVSLVDGRTLRTLQEGPSRRVMAIGADFAWVLLTDANDVPFLLKVAIE